jgi:hypothetical protein
MRGQHGSDDGEVVTAAATRGDGARYRGREVAGTALVALAVGAVSGSLLLEVLEGDLAGSFGPALAMLPFVIVTAIVVLRRPENPIGPLLAVVTLLLATGGLAERLELRYRGEPLGTWSSWYGEWWWVPMLTLLLVVVPLTFPNGELLSGRWRWVLYVVGCTATTAVLAAWFQSELPIGVAYDHAQLPTAGNPIGFAPWPEMEEAIPGWLFFGTLFPGALLGVISLVLRFRRSQGTERQQLKWAAFGLGAMGIGFLTNAVGDLLFGLRLPGLLETLFISAIPLAFGFAILRYRLYDIDRLISRTAVYALLTVLLVAVYAGSVVTFQGVLRPVTGSSDLAVAGSTLVVVALFHPVRRRLQHVVDRRFHRSRYDAQQMVSAFTARLRDQADLASFEADLREVVTVAVSPSHARLWLPPGRQGTEP